MGVRLVKYGVNTGVYNHDELLNKDLPDQHPISAITGLEEKLNEINSIENVENTKTLTLVYDETTKTLSGDVNVFSSEDNAIQVKATGLFVDKYLEIETADTDTIHLYMEGLGETLETMYNGGNVFSHNGGTTNIANTTEANAWYFDTALDSFVQPRNTTTFTGFVSSIQYRTYTHRATLRSSASDNDANGLVIAYVKDENGYPHTLSCIINKGGESHAGSFYYALVYNRDLAGQQIIKTGTMSNGHTTGGWSGSYITMEVSKAGSTVECSISDWNSLDINLSTIMTIDLNDYSWGYLFKGRVQYGYCNQSQPNSYFTDIYFNGKGPLKAEVILSPDNGNALEIRDNGLYCSGGGSGGSSNSNVLTISQAAHGLNVGNAVYLKSDSSYAKAFGEDTERIEVVGVVTEVTDANSFIITVSGEFQTDIYDSYPDGTVLYLSDNSSEEGLLTDRPTNYIKPIGIKISTGILINIQRANMYNLDGAAELVYCTDEEITDAIDSLW